ncbi:hypothetical protein Scep_001270 [Stephania cephalantha]|uniref:Pentatricopeptide repeat-containing protein n=1 Tax=Stephania cephalantha TaxID=152367 RepID=A0AAP0LBQ1_9MAGN
MVILPGGAEMFSFYTRHTTSQYCSFTYYLGDSSAHCDFGEDYKGIPQRRVTRNESRQVTTYDDYIGDLQEIHGEIVKVCADFNVLIGTNLVKMYGEIGKLSDALRVFDEMPERDSVARMR